MEKVIIKEENVEMDNLMWKKITYNNGEIIYKRFDEEFKVWIVLEFKKPLE